METSIDGRDDADSALLGIGVTYTDDSGVSASLRYNGEMADDFTSHGVIGQIRFAF